jgi:hypothetical protein
MKRASLLDHFSALEDPRQSWKTVYPLPEILLLVLCGVMAGADDFVEIARWGERKIAFLRRFLPFREGVPSHDTRERRDERPAGGSVCRMLRRLGGRSA